MFERSLEPLFRQYIKSIVENSSNQSWKIRYHSAIPDGGRNAQTEWDFCQVDDQACQATLETVTITVLSPHFYTRFFCFGTITEAIMSEYLELDDKRRRLQIKGHHDIFQREEHVLLAKITPYKFIRPTGISRLDNLRWYIILAMRSRMRSTGVLSDQICKTTLLPMDRLVLQTSETSIFRTYTKYVLRALLVEKFGLGDEMYLQTLVRLVWFILFIRSWSAMFGSRHTDNYASQHRNTMTEYNETICMQDRTEVDERLMIAPQLKVVVLQVYWVVRLVLDV